MQWIYLGHWSWQSLIFLRKATQHHISRSVIHYVLQVYCRLCVCVCVCTGAMVCVPHWVAAGSWTDELSQQEHHLWFQSSSSQPHRRPEGTMTTTTTTTQCSMDLTISNDAIRPTAATQSDWRTVCIQGGPVIVLKAKQWILTSYKSRAI